MVRKRLVLEIRWKVHGEVPLGNTAMEASFLNRVIRCDPTSGAELEADTRHVTMVFRDLGLETSTPVVAPVAKGANSEELPVLACAKRPRRYQTYWALLHELCLLALDRVSHT